MHVGVRCSFVTSVTKMRVSVRYITKKVQQRSVSVRDMTKKVRDMTKKGARPGGNPCRTRGIPSRRTSATNAVFV
jgi:hypothetical protein